MSYNISRDTITINATPQITEQPESAAVCKGTDTSFSVTPTGINLSYQWLKLDSGIWSPISNAILASYIIHHTSV